MLYPETSFQRRKTNQSILLYWNNLLKNKKNLKSSDYKRVDHVCQRFCKDSNHCTCMVQLENSLAFRLILTENKIAVAVFSPSFLYPIAFKTYQSQYRSKYSIQFTQILNFPLSRTFAISNLFPDPVGVRESGCQLYFYSDGI